MLSPVDGWTIGHVMTGFFLGRIRLSRWVVYPVTVIWEVYQLYFHYQPRGYTLSQVWVNSVVDIIVCLLLYEVAKQYSIKECHPIPHVGMTNQTTQTAAYLLLSLGIALLFWNDIFRHKILMQISWPLVPVLLGALSPVPASFIVHQWTSCNTGAKAEPI